jgi:hypothetical protein
MVNGVPNQSVPSMIAAPWLARNLYYTVGGGGCRDVRACVRNRVKLVGNLAISQVMHVKSLNGMLVSYMTLSL